MIYFEDGKIIAQSGNVTIYDYENDLYLEIGPGHNLWAVSSEIREYRQQLGTLPIGDCLEIGLGLGVVSDYILSVPKVTSLTTIDINKNIIECYRQMIILNDNMGDIRHNIIVGDVNDVFYKLIKTELSYDFIFFDQYSLIDEDTIEDLTSIVDIAKKHLLRENGIIMGWFDPYTPKEFIDPFYEIFKMK